MGLIADGLSMLNTTLFASEGETMTYRRWATSASLSVVFGSTEFSEETRNGAVIITRAIDALVKTADYLLAGFETPKPGDRIEKTDSVTGKALSFEVVAVAGGPCWTYSDTGRVRMRIHLKQVAEI